MRIEARDRPPRDDWDAFVATHSVWNPLFLTSAWADYYARWSAIRPRYVCVYDEAGEWVAAWLALVSPLSALRAGWKGVMLRCLDGAVSEMRWLAPPALTSPDLAPDVALALERWMRRFAVTHRVVRIAGGPWLRGGNGLGRLGTWATYLLDCRKVEQDLWTELRAAARKAIRKAQESGLTVRRLTARDEVVGYYGFAEQAARRTNRRLPGPEDFLAAWDSLRGRGHLEFFVAEHGGEIVSGLGVRGYAGFVSEFGLYQSEHDVRGRLNGQDLIKWEIIRWARTAGVHTFDLAGVSPRPGTAKEAGIHQFKKKWGGVYLEYPVVRPHWVPLWRRSNPGA